MKTIPVVHEEASVSPIEEDGKAAALYHDFVAASVTTSKLKKKLIREESKIDRLGFPPKKIRKLAARLEEATSRKLETLAELNEMKVA